jgi:hypothetical protein
LDNKYLGQVLLKRVLREILGKLVLSCYFVKTGLHNILFGLKAGSQMTTTFEGRGLGNGSGPAASQARLMIHLQNFSATTAAPPWLLPELLSDDDECGLCLIHHLLNCVVSAMPSLARSFKGSGRRRPIAEDDEQSHYWCRKNEFS